MNVDEAMRRFADTEEVPREALQWALDNWEQASPRLIAKLRAYAGRAQVSEADLEALFFIIYLCGEKCDSRAYAPVCDLIVNDETIDIWFAESATGDLGRILINLCDGDVEPLQRAIEAAEADEFGRAASLQALAYLVRAKVHLGYEPLRGEVARVFAKKWIDPLDGSLDDFYFDLQLARRDPDGMAAFAAAGVEPFESAIESFERWAAEDDEEWEGAVDEMEAGDEPDAPVLDDLPIGDGTPYLNPLRAVGQIGR